jgi:hypothetical protein
MGTIASRRLDITKTNQAVQELIEVSREPSPPVPAAGL